jgi:hypothetical protein
VAVAISQKDRSRSSPQPLFSTLAPIARLLEHPDLEKYGPALIPYIDPKTSTSVSCWCLLSPTPFTIYIVVVTVPTTGKGAKEPDKSNG